MMRYFYFILLFAGFGAFQLGAKTADHPTTNSIPNILLDSVHTVSCAGAEDGAIFITIKQAQAPFTFLWSNGDTNEDLVDVPAGIYSCTVTDANGESAVLSDVPVTAPQALVVSLDSQYVPDCLGQLGSLVVSASGGTPFYAFDWSDGQSGPVRTDLPEGEYTVTATDANGCTATLTAALFTDFPQASATDAEITCANPTVLISGEGSSVGSNISYAWSTSDGLILGAKDSIDVVAGGGGIYGLVVTNTLNGCTSDAEAIISVDTVAPFADAGPDLIVPCTNSIDTLQSDAPVGAGYLYSWTASDGGHFLSNTDSVKAVFDHVGQFVFTVQNLDNACSSSDTVVVTGLFEPPAALAFGDTLTCVIDSVLLTAQFDTLNTQFAWQGPGGFSSNLPNPKVGDSGIFVLTVTDTITGCFIQAPAIVVLDTVKPIILNDFAGDITCASPLASIGVNVDTAIATTFYWTGPGAFESFEQSPFVAQAGEYIVVATNEANGCTVADTLSVEGDLAPPLADAGPDRTLGCLATLLELDGSGSTMGDSIAYVWTTLDGNVIADDSTTSPLVNAPGTYLLTVTNLNNGCTSSDETFVDSDNTLPTASASVNDTLSCTVSEVQLFGIATPDNDVSVAWTGPDGFTSGDLEPFVSAAGTYVLTVTYLPSSCSVSAEVEVYTSATLADAGPDETLTCVALSVQLDGSASSSGTNFIYVWTTADGNIVSGDSTLTPLVDAVGTYSLTVFDTTNDCSSSATTTVGLDILPPTADAGPDGFLTCSTQSITLDGTASSSGPGFAYAWSTADGNIVSGNNTATATVNASGDYVLILTNLVNGCTASDTSSVSADLSVPTASASAIGMLTCVTGAVLLSGSSSTPAAVYHWSGPNGFVSNEQNPLVNAPGNYVLTVQNPVNGCTATATATVLANMMPPTLSASAGPLTCAQPSVTIMTTALPANVTFVWSGPNNFFSNLQNPAVSLVGFYNVVATNPMNGCSNSVSVFVGQNVTPPTVTASGGTLTCIQQTVQLNASASPAGATLSWSGPNGFTSNLANPTVSEPGNYTVVATNPANGCTAEATAMVASNIQLPTAYAGVDRPLNCVTGLLTLSGFGSSSGSDISYNWTTLDGNFVVGQNTLAPRVDQPGTYTLIVTNTSTGCTATDDVLVTAPIPVTAVISSVQAVSCNGGSNGAATVLGGGGTGIYHYGWSTGAETAGISGLSAGTYGVTVYDQEGCTATATATITEPTALTATVSTTAQTIPGVNNGTATAAGQGGTGPYTYLWNTGATTATITGLAPGTYTVTLMDAQGCTTTAVGNVNASNCALVGTVNITAPNCAGQNNGAATAIVTGANGAITYAWSNGASTATVQNLAPGTYSLTVSDAAGCTLFLPVQITAPQPVTLAVLSQQNVLCANDEDGSIVATAGGGVPPYNFEWSNGIAGATNPNLAPGTYTLTATDSHGCSQTLSATIVETDQTPPVLLLHDAIATLGANGTVQITAAMFDAGTLDAECGMSSLSVAPTTFGCGQLGPQLVTLTATDNNGNIATGTATVTITDNIVPTLICPANIAVSACQATVQFNPAQVADNCPIDPLKLILSNGLPSGSTFPNGVTPQAYSYSDAAGNTATCTFTVSVANALSAVPTATTVSCGQTCDGSITLALSGGAPPITVAWSNGATGPSLNGLCPGNYAATVSDAGGCTLTLTVTVTSDDQEAPVLVLHNATVPLGSDGTVMLDISLFDGGSTDNCGALNWTISPDSFSCGDLGVHAVTLTATDAMGNSASQTVTATIIDDIEPTLMCNDDIVTGLCAAAVDYSWPLIFDNCFINASQVQLITGLPSGSQFPAGITTQTFLATDIAGNTGTCSFTITVAGPPTVTPTNVPLSCSGGCDASISLDLSGGDPPFTILWSTGATGPELTGLCAGDYSASLTDASGCTQTLAFSIDPSVPLSVNVDDVQHDLGSAGVGSIQITVTGGVAPYAFVWTRDGQFFANTEDLSGLSAGTYLLSITDANGCALAGLSIVVTNLAVGTKEPDWASDWLLLPNPASERVELRFGTPRDRPTALSLFDATGRLFLTTSIGTGSQTFTLDISTLQAGVWQVCLQSADGQRATKRLVVVH